MLIRSRPDWSSVSSPREELVASSIWTRSLWYLLFLPLTQTDFVTEATGKIAKKSYVMNHSKPSFDAMRSDTSKSHLIEIMSPFERACYDFSIQMEKAAEAFAVAFPCLAHR